MLLNLLLSYDCVAKSLHDETSWTNRQLSISLHEWSFRSAGKWNWLCLFSLVSLVPDTFLTSYSQLILRIWNDLNRLQTKSFCYLNINVLVTFTTKRQDEKNIHCKKFIDSSMQTLFWTILPHWREQRHLAENDDRPLCLRMYSGDWITIANALICIYIVAVGHARFCQMHANRSDFIALEITTWRSLGNSLESSSSNFAKVDGHLELPAC